MPDPATIPNKEEKLRILLVMTKAYSHTTQVILSQANLNVYATDLGEEGIDLAKLYNYDLILLDLDLPDIAGHEVLLQLRVACIETPVIVIGPDNYNSKIKSFGFGADDYLTRSLRYEELVARIRAIIRRCNGHAQSIMNIGKVSVNIDTQTAYFSGKSVHLTAKEYKILELMVLRKGALITKEAFLNYIYGDMDEPEQKILQVFISKLRRKIFDATGNRDYILTHWGRGYSINKEIQNATT